MIDLRQGDCFEIMKNIPDKSIDCIICDPPYNIGYAQWDNLFNIENALIECKRILKTDGNILIFQGYSNVCQTKNIMDKLFNFQDWIIYGRIKGRGGKKHLVSTREDILWYTNGDNYTFNKIPSTIIKKTGGLGKKNGCKYRALSNVWTDISPLVPWCEERKKYKHPTQKPYKLVERLVLLFTNEDDTILDFTMGTGVVGEASCKNNRNFIGIELDQKYFEIAKERIYKAQHEDKGEE